MQLLNSTQFEMGSRKPCIELGERRKILAGDLFMVGSTNRHRGYLDRGPGTYADPNREFEACLAHSTLSRCIKSSSLPFVTTLRSFTLHHDPFSSASSRQNPTHS
jgi:hypothetical protein